MNDIIGALTRLKGAFAQQEGVILNITLNKKGVDALDAECKRFCSHPCCVDICPTCGSKIENMILGIKIIEAT